MRPVDIEADVKEMERRKRVEAIMNSQVSTLTTVMKSGKSKSFHISGQEERSFSQCLAVWTPLTHFDDNCDDILCVQTSLIHYTSSQ